MQIRCNEHGWMSDEEFATYASYEAETPLELELVDRLTHLLDLYHDLVAELDGEVA